ncbi:MAG: WD40 repeat domain-containing protein [Myxococcota bacterium]
MKPPALQHAGLVEVVALSHCGGYLFVSTAQQAWLFTWPGGKLRQTVRLAPIFDARFKEDGMLALSGARTVTMVGLPHLERRPSAKKVSGTGVPAAVWLYGDRLVTASLDPARALLLDFLGNRLATLDVPGAMVFSVATDDRRIAAHGDVLQVWDDTTLAGVGTGSVHGVRPGYPVNMRFHHNGKPVVGSMPAVFGLDFSPSGQTLVSAGSDGRVVAWDPATVTPRVEIDEPVLDYRKVVALDDQLAYATTTTGLVRVDLVAGRVDRLVPFQRFRYRWWTPIGLSLSRDRKTLVFGGMHGEVGVWDLVADRRVG